MTERDLAKSPDYAIGRIMAHLDDPLKTDRQKLKDIERAIKEYNEARQQ